VKPWIRRDKESGDSSSGERAEGKTQQNSQACDQGDSTEEVLGPGGGSLGGEDYEDNLTYHEDSLSVLRGTATTPLGKEVPVWVTTDSGSMTQLISAKYADKMKFEVKDLPASEWFNISSPGGGQDAINQCVQIALRVKMKREDTPDARYDDNRAEEVEKTVLMKFGLCENLPVPILWGGKEMREFGLLDYHCNKVLSLKLGDGLRYVTQSTSWLVAAAEMSGLTNDKVRRAYREFIPSLDRLTNMVRGERNGRSIPGILYPGKDNIVRIGRRSARVDEGYSEVLYTIVTS
jgi:hypothetical protein